MFNLQKLDHFKDNMDQFFGQPFWDEFESILNPNLPAVNVFRKEYEIIVACLIPNLKNLKSITCTIQDYSILLTGEIRLQPKGFETIQEEIIQGSFNRTIELPCKVRTDQKNAYYQQGILWIELYKDVQALEKNSNVKIANQDSTKKLFWDEHEVKNKDYK
ncbi:Hsp20/alpha crystallin family protein [Halalkalibacillus halophilus]|uniref:Hsp20 family protein n=1 Tax=Halalkalibacillus halophilus TaxID=392827 RepID=UPI0004251A07|nr:Hsp20/alpha crystallin family protein [Halalkalibacillus halophilus]